jgi:hypothetical protein
MENCILVLGSFSGLMVWGFILLSTLVIRNCTLLNTEAVWSLIRFPLCSKRFVTSQVWCLIEVYPKGGLA